LVATERVLILTSKGLLVGDNHMNNFKVLNDSVEVSEVDATTSEVAALW
jgi:hypothetical protein